MRTLLKITRHIKSVQSALKLVIDELSTRSEVHDISKFNDDEFTGFARFDSIPDGLEYGSKEYEEAKAAATKDNNAINLHYKRNDHHPEHYENVHKMRFPEIIEMVADWAGAHLEYGNVGGWHASVEKNIAKHDFMQEQIWLIRDVSLFLSSRIPKLQDNELQKEN